MKNYYDVFISYRRDKGATLAEETARSFRGKYQVFFDREEIVAGSFREVIANGIEKSLMVFSLLSVSSIQRMYQAMKKVEGTAFPVEDVVFAELEQCRLQGLPVVFVFFQESQEIVNPFDLLAQEEYKNIPLFQWISSLHINEYKPMADFQKMLDIVEGIVLEERALRGEKEQELLRLEHKQPLLFQGEQLEYMGEHFLNEGQIVPVGQGKLFQVVSRSESRGFHGKWYGGQELSGEGTLQVTRVLKAPEDLYKGAWHKLLFHDKKGVFHDHKEQYQGGFYQGEKCFRGKFEDTEEIFTGVFHKNATLVGVKQHKKPDACSFFREEGNYFFYPNGVYFISLDREIAQCFVQDGSHEYRFLGEIIWQEGGPQLQTVKEVAVRDLQESTFQVVMWGDWLLKESLTGRGTFVLEDEDISASFSGDFLEGYGKSGSFLFPNGTSLYANQQEVLLNSGELVPKNKENMGYQELLLRFFFQEYKFFSCLQKKVPLLHPSAEFVSYHETVVKRFRQSLHFQDRHSLRQVISAFGQEPLWQTILK